MAFVPSRYSAYGSTADTVTALAPLAISAGTQIATTAITHSGRRRKKKKGADEEKPKAEAEVPASEWPDWAPLALGAAALAAVAAFALSRPKAAAAAA